MATLAAGGLTYLRRVGFVDRPSYEDAWARACLGFGTVDTPFGIGQRCTPQPGGGRAWLASYDERLGWMSYVWRVEGVDWALKAGKDLATLALIGSGLVLLAACRPGGGGLRRGLALFTLAALLVLLGFAALGRGELLPAAAGLRSFSFVAVGLVALAVPVSVASVAKGIVLLLGVQAVLTPLELLRGLPLHRQLPFWDLPGRMAGTFVMPNSLGVFAAAGTAWVFSSGLSRGWKVTAATLAVVLVALSGSGAGWVLLAAMTGFGVARFRGWPIWSRIAVVLAIGACLIAFLPRAVNRPDLLESLQSRIGAVRSAIAVPTARLLVGEGLGHGTNVEQTVRQEVGPWADGRSIFDPGAADSMVFSVLRQAGTVGVVLVGLAIVEALMAGSGLGLFLGVAALGGLALNVAELFPLNVLFGLALGARRVDEARNADE